MDGVVNCGMLQVLAILILYLMLSPPKVIWLAGEKSDDDSCFGVARF